MDPLSQYWSPEVLAVNGLICLNLAGALGVGVLLGYERSFHGRAAGMRTYALVCMASTLLTVICGYPQAWYGGGPHGAGDPTRVIQGIVTGIGFLGAGVIMKEGFSISGLSTSASIWTVAAIGVTLGLGFYAAAIMATASTLVVMSAFKRLEQALPHHQRMQLTFAVDRAKAMGAEELRASLLPFGVEVMDLACQSSADGHRFQYDLVLVSEGAQSFDRLVDGLARADGITEFRLSPVRG
jgi:putative Mg2+ transporter-C (MgtC) family protein